MKIEFERIEAKNRQVGVRLTENEYKKVEKIAKENKVSIMEVSRQLMKMALKEIKTI